MANDEIVKRMKQMFHLNDLDKDNVHSLKDADLFADRFCTAHKFDEDRKKQVKEKAYVFWRKFNLVGSAEQTNEAEYVQDLTNKFKTNSEELYKELIENIKILIEIFDVDNDGFISTEELMIALKAWGLSEVLDESFVANFPQVKPGFIKIEDYVIPWVAYTFNTDEALAKPITEAMKKMSDAGIVP